MKDIMAPFTCERCPETHGICKVGEGPWLCSKCFWERLNDRVWHSIEESRVRTLKGEIEALKAELEGWKKGVIDANKISQRYAKENDDLRLEIARLQAMLADGL